MKGINVVAVVATPAATAAAVAVAVVRAIKKSKQVNSYQLVAQASRKPEVRTGRCRKFAVATACGVCRK